MQAINEASRTSNQQLFQLAHTHGEPDGSIVTDHIGVVYADSAQHAREMGAVFFFVPVRQVSAWLVEG